MRDRLRIGGLLHTATDWPDYAEQMLEVLAADGCLLNAHEGYAPTGRAADHEIRTPRYGRRPTDPRLRVHPLPLTAGYPLSD